MSSIDDKTKAMLEAAKANPDAAPQGETAPRAAPHPMTVAGIWDLFYQDCLKDKSACYNFLGENLSKETIASFESFTKHVWYASAVALFSIVTKIGEHAEDEQEGALAYSKLNAELVTYQEELLARVLLQAVNRLLGDSDGAGN